MTRMPLYSHSVLLLKSDLRPSPLGQTSLEKNVNEPYQRWRACVCRGGCSSRRGIVHAMRVCVRVCVCVCVYVCVCVCEEFVQLIEIGELTSVRLYDLTESQQDTKCRTQILKVSKIDCLKFVVCPLLAPILIGFFFAEAINSTNEANKAGGTCR